MSRSSRRGISWSNFTVLSEKRSGEDWRVKLSASAGRPLRKTCTRSTSNQFGHWTRTFSVAWPPGAARSSPGIAAVAPAAPPAAELDLQEWSARHDQVAALGGVDDVERPDLGRVVGRTLHVVPQPSRAVEVVVGVGVDHAGNAPALVQELEPVDDRVVIRLSARLDGRLVEDRVGRMNLDHVDMSEHARKARVRVAVAVAVVEHPADVGMVDLNELVAGAVPEGQPLDLDLGVIVGRWAAAILGVRPA